MARERHEQQEQQRQPLLSLEEQLQQPLSSSPCTSPFWASAGNSGTGLTAGGARYRDEEGGYADERGASALGTSANDAQQQGSQSPRLESALASYSGSEKQHHHAETSNAAHATLNFSKAILGAAMMGIPHAFHMLGILLGYALLWSVSGLTFFTVAGIAGATDKTGASTYAAVADKTAGRLAKLAVQISVLLFCFGISTVYLDIIADVLCGSGSACDGVICEATGVQGTWYTSRAAVLGVLILLVVAPTLSMKSVDKLAFFNTAGVAAIFVVCLATSLMAGAALHQGTAHPLPWLPNTAAFGEGRGAAAGFSAFVTAAAIVPVLLTSCVCHQNFHSMRALLQPYSLRRVNLVSGAALFLCTTLYTSLAVSACVAFGPDVQGNFLSNINRHSATQLLGATWGQGVQLVTRLGYSVSILGSYLLYMHPLRDCLFEIIGEGFGPHRGAVEDKWFYPLTYTQVGMTYLVAVAVPSVWDALTVIGGIASTVEAFIVPGVIVLSIERGASLVSGISRGLGWLVVVLGTLLFINSFMVPIVHLYQK